MEGVVVSSEGWKLCRDTVGDRRALQILEGTVGGWGAIWDTVEGRACNRLGGTIGA